MWVSKIENRFLGDTRSRFPRRMLSPVESSYHVIFPRTKDPIHRMRVRLVRNDRNAACLIGISLSNARNPLANTRVIISSQTKRNDERSFCWVSKKIRNLRGIVARADNEEPGCIWFLESNETFVCTWQASLVRHPRSQGPGNEDALYICNHGKRMTEDLSGIDWQLRNGLKFNCQLRNGNFSKGQTEN